MDESGDEYWWDKDKTNNKVVHMQQFVGGFGDEPPEGFRPFTRRKPSLDYSRSKTKRKENHMGYLNHKVLEQLNYQAQSLCVYFRTESFNTNKTVPVDQFLSKLHHRHIFAFYEQF